MPVWLIFAALGAIGVTALLVLVLYRINLPNQTRRDAGHGGVSLADGGAHGKSGHDADSGDGAGDGGGGE